ncbi:hypothetical protein DFP93_1322 [Aneurinibacillus soli]|uniref:Uncharacterized protein n=1 Tax=Aneurinibacillus soli TaxID=1500254 RepID=A0A0U5BG31_9BACL|nr:DUF2953 domain-containing protein [Aneurinibacillus soli]PYE57243.1 hypothetical protein DFP93_1322 [Aneurinibacillus soli]BAU29239.1 hypothetical protein CB4_03426 [Aneurinibacillus soli]
MNGWLLGLGIAGVILLIIWFTSLRIQIVYRRQAENDDLEIELSVYGRLLRYRIHANMLQLRNLRTGVKIAEEADAGTDSASEEKERKKKEWITPHTIAELKRTFMDVRRRVYDMDEILRTTLKCVLGENLEWQTHVGVGEAAATGAVSGMVWTAKNVALAILGRYITLYTEPKLMVVPDFSRTRLDIRFLCILRLRIGHAIIAAIRIAIHYFRKGR